MDLRHLRTFILVAEHLSFTAAAKHLSIAQPAVSIQVANLEEDLGVTLLLRDRRSVRLTAAGALLLKEARSLIERADNLAERVRQAGAGQAGSLRIGFLPSERGYLSHHFKRFCDEYTHIELSLFQYDIKTLCDSLEHDDLDVVIIQDFALEGVPEILRQPLYSDRFAVVMRADHPLAHAGTFRLPACAEEAFVFMNRAASPSLFRRVSQICVDRGGFTPRVVRYAHRMATVLTLVDAGIGISIVPRHLETADFSSLRFFNIRGADTSFEVAAAWKNTDNPSVDLFVRHLKDSVAMAPDFQDKRREE
ncbi:MAG: LysR family transcriptional regulator [Bryobacteraceae bacterium]|nr:LysR family transcriptional regulator [Bryobacteraceae bacterium]